MTHLSFTIGPVQGFVSQARRTRDLWAGSWLLSYLAETALVAAEKAGGLAIIPHRPEREVVTSKRTVTGGIPNRFECAYETKEQAVAAGEAAKKAFEKAWLKLANAVWDKFVAPVADKGHGTRAIWERQIENFWEVSWVVATPEEDEKTIGRLAAARKAFRNVEAEPEEGVKCSLMGTLQEISGHFGGPQKMFWEHMRSAMGAHDLRKGERLCAISLIKRLYPRVIRQAVGDDITPELEKQESWPSLAFFAALPWLRMVSAKARDDAQAYADMAQGAAFDREKGQKIGESERQAMHDAKLPKWAGVDAPVWFKSALRNNDWKLDASAQAGLLKSLGALYDKVPHGPVPYYALLLMDGDSMGTLLGKLGDPGRLSKNLGNFSRQVAKTVEQHDGRTIYAGGDDVMALLPAVNAFPAAEELAGQYEASFTKDGKPIPEATLSGALVYAHWRRPMQQVVGLAHRLLDERAKNDTGRDALAIGIVQGSGLNALWSAPWQFIRGDVNNTALEELLNDFGGDDTDQESATFNASYLYNLRQQFSRLFPALETEPGEFGVIDIEMPPAGQDGGEESLFAVVAHAEYRRRMKMKDRAREGVEGTGPRINALMSLSRRWKRDKQYVVASDSNTFGFDGWRVARFMKQVQEGKVGDHE